MLDNTFRKEISALAGDGSRDSKFAMWAEIKATAKDMSNPKIEYTFDAAVKSHGCAKVGICVAATVLERCDRLEPETVQWAREVIRAWPNSPRELDGSFMIQDGLHPTKIEKYAGNLILLTIA